MRCSQPFGLKHVRFKVLLIGVLLVLRESRPHEWRLLLGILNMLSFRLFWDQIGAINLDFDSGDLLQLKVVYLLSSV